jgi:uncharacterized protein (DUF1015 family)
LEVFIAEAQAAGLRVRELKSPDELKRAWSGARSAIGAAMGDRLFIIETDPKDLDIQVLHERVLGGVLGIGEEAVKDEKHVRYIRGLEPALDAARQGAAQIAFLLKPVAVDQVAEVSFAGSVMPQKSTDFYPKLLSGMAIYKLEK